MTRTLAFALLVLAGLFTDVAEAAPDARKTADRSAQIDGFAGASGTGKTVAGGFASDGGLGGTR
ncbi:hypothetical protein KZZ07_05355 [Mameliella sp. CS4]|uniref:hypothetical protein n=1 Tax=Mameliella sp. CS4 TaxID=2862329 RepID=UPI001C5F7682|nr:hypothetical protein [Mameliella sp. CS4]MBW4981966.1 hypothetical protein [Mameliella sp. CS4]